MLTSLLNTDSPSSATGERFILWVDGVGSWLILTRDVLTVGRATGTPLTGRGTDEADISMMASLSRRHATLTRSSDAWILRNHSTTSVNGREIELATVLPETCELGLGSSVRFRFRMPTPLSTSAELTPVSGHRLMEAVDGVVLMADTCLLGPGTATHVRCPDWNSSIVLAKTADGISARARDELAIDGKPVSGMVPLSHGQVVTGDSEVRFHLERLA